MEFKTVLDISSIIWDKNDFGDNKHQYYKLTVGISTLLEKLEKEQSIILLRDELLDEMLNGFPFDALPNEFHDFGRIVYSFLGKIGNSIQQYPISSILNIESIPNLIKPHYNPNTQNEIGYLISHIHKDSKSKSVYFTFEYLWEKDNVLRTEVNGRNTKEYETIIADKGSHLDDFFLKKKPAVLRTEVNGKNTKEYETIIVDKESELDVFFVKLKPVFEHNSKHDRTLYNDRGHWQESNDKGDFVSRLSCYNGSDNKRPQEVLDKRFPEKIGGCYIGYDNENEVYVMFRLHIDNKYHGYDEYDLNKIPLKVKRHFNK